MVEIATMAKRKGLRFIQLEPLLRLRRQSHPTELLPLFQANLPAVTLSVLP